MRPRVMAFMTMSAALVAPSLRMMWLRWDSSGVGGPELAHDVAAVGLDGVLGDIEDRGDLAGVLAVGYQLEYFEFFRGEGGASGSGFAARGGL